MLRAQGGFMIGDRVLTVNLKSHPSLYDHGRSRVFKQHSPTHQLFGG